MNSNNIPFDVQSMSAVSNINPSDCQQKKLTIKLTNPSNVTKRVREIPENFVALKKIVKTQMSKKGTFMEKLIASEAYSITYTDDCGDVINVSDDEDLMAAFEVAEQSLGNQLKLNVLPRNTDESALEASFNSSMIMVSKEKELEQIQKEQVVQKLENLNIIEDKKVEQKQPEPKQIEEEKKPEFSDDLIRSAIQETLADQMSSDSSDSEDFDEITNDLKDSKKNSQFQGNQVRHVQKQLKKEKRIEMRKALRNEMTKEQRVEMRKDQRTQKKQIIQNVKEINGGLPRKAFKKLIKKELEKQKIATLNALMNCKEIGEYSDPKDINDDAKQINTDKKDASQPQVHNNVACDGCNVEPITGVRYKCSVCKNFDFCSNCEERRDHDHPFLKIVRPDQCPKAIFTVVNEGMANVQADLEQNINSTFFRNMGPTGQDIGKNMQQFFSGMFKQHGPCQERRGGRGGMGGGRGMFHGKRPNNMRNNNDSLCSWKMKRAEIVSGVPSNLMALQQDKTSFLTVTVKNNTEWPWKQGCVFANKPYENGVSDILEDVKIFITDFVGGRQNYTFKIPLTVKATAKLSENCSQSNQATFSFFGPKGCCFGEPIVVTFKVVKIVNDIEVYQKAIEILEKQEYSNFKFEDITEALILSSNDETAAIVYLKSTIQQQKAKENEQSVKNEL